MFKKHNKQKQDVQKKYCDIMTEVFIKACEQKVNCVTVSFDGKPICNINMDFKN